MLPLSIKTMICRCKLHLEHCKCSKSGGYVPCDSIELLEKRSFMSAEYMKYKMVVKMPIDPSPLSWSIFYNHVVTCLATYHCFPAYKDDAFVYTILEFPNTVASSTLETFENRMSKIDGVGLLVCDKNDVGLKFTLTAVVINPDKLDEAILPVYVMKLQKLLDIKDDQSIIEKVDTAEKLLVNHLRHGSGNISQKGSYKMKCIGELPNCHCGAQHFAELCEFVKNGKHQTFYATEYMRYHVCIRAFQYISEEERIACFNDAILRIIMIHIGKRNIKKLYLYTRIEFPNASATTEMEVLAKVLTKVDFTNIGTCKKDYITREFTLHAFVLDSSDIGNVIVPSYLGNMKSTLKIKDVQSLLEELIKLEQALEKQVNSLSQQSSNTIQCKGELEECDCKRTDHLRDLADVLPQSSFNSRAMIIRSWNVSIDNSFFILHDDKRDCYCFVAAKFFEHLEEFVNIHTFFMFQIISNGGVFDAFFKPYLDNWPHSLIPLLFKSNENGSILKRKFTLTACVIYSNEFVNSDELNRVMTGIRTGMLAEYNEELMAKHAASGLSNLLVENLPQAAQIDPPMKQEPSIHARLLTVMFEKVINCGPEAMEKIEQARKEVVGLNTSRCEITQLRCVLHARVHLLISHDFTRNSLILTELQYSLAAYQIFSSMCGDNGFYGNSHLCFTIHDDGGYVISTGLRSGSECLLKPEITFPSHIKLKKLKNKYHLDVLIVDGTRFDDPRLYALFIANIKSRIKNTSDGTTILEKAIKAEQWLSSLIEKLSKRPGNISQQPKVVPKTINLTATSSASSSITELDALQSQSVELDSISNKFMSVARWYAEISQKAIKTTQSDDDAALFCKKADEVIKKDYSQLLTPKSRIMFEFRSMGGTIITTDLVLYSQHTVKLMTASIRKQLQPSAFKRKFILSIYFVQAVSSDINSEKVTHLVNLYRRSNEKSFLTSISSFTDLNKEIKFKPAITPFVECSEPYEYPCSCNKFHLRDICTIKVEKVPNQKRLTQRKWTVSWTEPCISSLDTNFLVSVVANRLCCIDFAETFNAGTHLQYIFNVNRTIYKTDFRHYSDHTVEHLNNQLTCNQEVNLKKKVKITVFVVQTLEFVSKEAALAALRNLQAGAQGPTTSVSYLKQTESTKDSDSLNGSIPAVNMPIVRESPWEDTSRSSDAQLLQIDVALFKKHSQLAEEVSSTSIPVETCYSVLSTSTKLCTSKSKIIVVNVSLNNEYLEGIIDDNILISHVIMDIINKNGSGYPARKEKRITIKLIIGGQTIQTVCNSGEECNPNVINSEMFRERSVQVHKQFRLEVQYRLLK